MIQHTVVLERGPMSSIADLTGQGPSITDPNQALSFFANRSSLIRHFASYLNGEPARNQILFIHGQGGNGKTLLLRYLEKHCCKRLTPVDWLNSRRKNDDDFRDALKDCTVHDPVAKAMLDFAAQPTVEQNPKDPFSGLLMMRGQLAEAGIPFPLFDFACTWYVHKTKRLTLERLQQLIPTEGLTVILAVAKALMDPSSLIDLAQVLLDSVDRHLQGRFSQYTQARKLSRAAVQKILEMDFNKDLVNQMPVLFAEDLNAAMQTPGMPRRVVLLFDGHDALWRAKDATDATDTWLRTLLTRLHLDSGIVSVVSGREKPRWAREEGAVEPYIPGEFVDAQLLGGLKAVDADKYLILAGVADEGVRAQLIRMAEAEPDQAHPLLLGLLVDVYRLAPSGFRLELDPVQTKVQDKIRVVLERLQTYASDEIRNGIQALSACRTFDWELHQYLGQKLAFSTTRATFDTVVRFSFVSEVGGPGSKRYRVHDLLRRLLRESGAEFHLKADPVLEEYYRTELKGAGDAAAVEAIYHASRWDGARAVTEWMKCMKEALLLSRYDVGRLLLDVRGQLEAEASRQGYMSWLAGRYYSIVSLYGEAELEYKQAVACFDQALARTPEGIDALTNLGNALSRLGDLYAELSQHAEAIESYSTAIATYDKALTQSPGKVSTHNNKGIVLQSLGDLYGGLAQHVEAMESYRSAITAFDRALSQTPEDPEVQNNKGNALQRLGALYAGLSHHTEAMESYRSAIATYEHALARAPEDPEVQNNKGIVLEHLGTLYAGLSHHAEALESFHTAIAAFDKALAHAPDFVEAHNGKGNAFRELGDLYAMLSRHSEAMESYRTAITSYDQALTRAPEYVYAHNNKGIALQCLGSLYAIFRQSTEAMESFHTAIAAFDQALARAPEYVNGHNSKGIALSTLGGVYAALSEHEDALNSYCKAIAAFDRALALAPGDPAVNSNRGTTCQFLGDLHSVLSQNPKAIESYRSAIAAYEKALAIAPNMPQAQHGQRKATEKLDRLSSN